MAKKRQYFLYLSYEEAALYESVYAKAKKRDPRTNHSEVIRELMGFPPKNGLPPVTREEDRKIFLGRLSKDGEASA